MSEPTKACIRVLKFESAVRYYVKYPFRLVLNFLEWLFECINWCIAKAIMRWFGTPFIVYLFYRLGILMSESANSTIDDAHFMAFLGLFLGIIILGTFVMISWIDIPYRERELLDSYKNNITDE